MGEDKRESKRAVGRGGSSRAQVRRGPKYIEEESDDPDELLDRNR